MKNIVTSIFGELKNMNDTVICYYEIIYEAAAHTRGGMQHPLELSKQSRELLSLWKRSWQKNNWNTIILDNEYARQHHKYHEYDIDSLNNKLYDNWPNKRYIRACYRRLFAYCYFANINGSALWADYDVINYSFKPTLNIQYNTILGSGTSVVFLDRHGSSNIIDNIVSKSSGFDHRVVKKRFNPMIAVRNASGFNNEELTIPNDILTQNEECKYSDFVHYHGGLREPGLSRIEFIQKFRPI